MVDKKEAKKLLSSITPELTKDEKEKYFNLRHPGYVRILENIKKNSKVLDVGMGRAHINVALLKIGCEITGINLKQAYPERMQKYGFAWVELDAERDKFPFKDNTFDHVIFTEIMEHFLFHPRECIKEMFRVLKPGGSVICTVPNAIALQKRIYPWFHKSVYGNVDKFYTLRYSSKGRPYFDRHSRLFMLKEVVALFKKEGFKIKKEKHISLDEKIYQLKSVVHYEYQFKLGKILKNHKLLNYLSRKLWFLMGFLIPSGRSHIEVIAIK